MAFQTKQSRMAIVQEASEGALVAPSSSADYLAMQDGFSTDLSLNVLETAEIKASIGKAQSLAGFETGKASLSHYLRHSGTEGVAPQSGYSKLLKTIYGSEIIAGTEYPTIAGSTTSIVKLAAGVGANFQVGQGLLIKHAAFPWELAVVKSISADDLTVLFKLQNAPAVATSLGKAVLYKAQDSGHPTLSLFDYRANGAAIAAIAGCRVTDMTVEAEAGGLINAAFSLEGISNYWDPINITATDTYLDFVDDLAPLSAIIEAKFYKSPMQLAEALEVAMNNLGSSNAFTVVYDNATGKFVISSNGTTLDLSWNTGANTANSVGDKIGFSLAADSTGALSYTSATAQILSSPQQPAFDSPGTPLVAKANEVYIGSSSDNVCFCVSKLSYAIKLAKADDLCICSETGKQGSVLTSREVSVTMTASVPKWKADLFHKFINNQGVAFQFNVGPKSGGNYIPGQSGIMAIKDAAITVHKLGDSNGLVTLEIELSGFVDANGTSETYLNLM